MSSRPFRRILAAFLVTAFLSSGVPVFAEAADFPEPADVPSLWVHAWQWLVEQVGLAEAGPDATASAAAPEETKSDAGWMLDPDG